MEFWEWVDDSTTDGTLHGCDTATVDSVVCVPGFGDAMIRVGWLIQTTEGMQISNFDRHNSASSKARALNALRQAKYREKEPRNGDSVTPALRQRYGNNAPTVTREEKRREEKKQQQQEETPSGAAAPAADSLRDWATQQAKRPEWLPSGKPWITAKTWYALGTRIAQSKKVTLADYESIVREARDSRNTLKNPAAFIVKRLDEMTKEMEQ